MTDITKVTIAAVDQASEVFAKVQGSAERLHASYAKFLTIVSGTVGVGYFVHLIKGTMDAAEQIDKLSQKTGIAVQTLSELQYAASLNGLSIDDLAKGVKTLAQRMTEAADATSKSGQIMTALGVDLHAGPEKALEAIANKFKLLEDGTTKTALAVELFGKNGMAMIPMLNRGADELRKQREEARALGLAYGPEFAAAASQFNDNLKAIEAKSRALGIALTAAIQGPLVEISGAMKQAAVEGGALMAILVGIGGLLSGLHFDVSAKKMKEEALAEITAELQQQETFLKRLRTLSGVSPQELQAAANQINELAAAQHRLQSELRALEVPKAANAAADDKQTEAAKKLEAQLRGLLAGLGKQQADTTSAGVEFIATLEKERDVAAQLWGEQTKQIEVEARLQQLRRQGQKVDEDRARQLAQEIDASRALKKEIEDLAKAEDAARQSMEALVRTGDSEIASLRAANELAGKENETLGMSAHARERAMVLFQNELSLRRAITPEQRTVIELQNQERLSLLDARQAAEDYLSVFSQGASMVAQFFNDMLFHGKSAIESLRDLFKKLLAQMIEIFATRWTLQLGASLIGGTAGQALASAAGGVGQGSLVGAAASGIGSYISGTSIGGMAIGGFADVAAGWSGAGMGIATGAMEGATWMTALGSTLATTLAAIPVWGWIALAIVGLGTAIYEAFGGKGGGPKGGGYFGGTFSGSGEFQSPFALPGSAEGRFFTPSGADSQLQTIVTATSQGFFQALRAMGGTSSGVSFALGYDTDPNGTAQNRVSGAAYDSLGNPLFYQRDRDIGRDNSQIGPELQLESERAILAALQHSQFPDEVAKILNSIVAESASAADIQRILTAAQEMAGVLKAIPTLNIKGLSVDVLRQWQQGSETISQTLTRVATAFAQFDQAFMPESERIRLAQQSLTNTFRDLGIEIPSSTEEFYNLLHSISPATEAGRAMIETLLGVAPAFLNVTNAAQQARQQMEQLSQGFAQAAIAMHGGAGGALGREWARGQLEVAAQHWLDTVGNDAGTQTVASVIANIPNVDPAAALGYARGAGTQGVEAITALFNAYNQWQNALTSGTNTTSTSLGTFTSSISDAERAAAALAQQLAQARQGVGDWLTQTLFGDLSTLNPQQKLALARQQYEDNLARAMSGDASAISSYTGYADTYLRQARGYYASSGPYQDIFSQVTNQAAAIAGQDYQSRMLAVLPASGGKLASQADIQDLARAIRDYLNAVASGNEQAITQQNQVLKSMPSDIANAASSAGRR